MCPICTNQRERCASDLFRGEVRAGARPSVVSERLIEAISPREACGERAGSAGRGSAARRGKGAATPALESAGPPQNG